MLSLMLLLVVASYFFFFLFLFLGGGLDVFLYFPSFYISSPYIYIMGRGGGIAGLGGAFTLSKKLFLFFSYLWRMYKYKYRVILSSSRLALWGLVLFHSSTYKSFRFLGRLA